MLFSEDASDTNLGGHLPRKEWAPSSHISGGRRAHPLGRCSLITSHPTAVWGHGIVTGLPWKPYRVPTPPATSSIISERAISSLMYTVITRVPGCHLPPAPASCLLAAAPPSQVSRAGPCLTHSQKQTAEIPITRGSVCGDGVRGPAQAPGHKWARSGHRPRLGLAPSSCVPQHSMETQQGTSELPARADSKGCGLDPRCCV